MRDAQAILGLSLLTVAAQAGCTALLAALVVPAARRGPVAARGLAWVGARGRWLLLLVALLGTAGSLYLSEGMGLAPCRLCWPQRLALYPQVPLVAISLWRRDKEGLVAAVLALCLAGLVLSGAHYALQVLAASAPPPAAPFLPCDASGASCSRSQIGFVWGYISVPLMALTAFALNSAVAVTILGRPVPPCPPASATGGDAR